MIHPLIQKLKSKKILLAVAVLSTLSLGYIAYVLKNSNAPYPASSSQTAITPIPIDIQASNPETRSLTYSNVYLAQIKFPPLPENLNVYPIVSSNVSIKSIAERLASRYNLTLSKQVPNFWSNSDSSQTLALSSQSPHLTYYVDGYLNRAAYIGTKPPQKNPSLNTARTFVQSLPELKSLSPNLENINYSKLSGEDFEKSSPSEANIIEIPFHFNVDNYPVFIDDSTDPPLTVTTGQNNNIVRIEINANVFNSLGAPRQLPVISSSKALDILTSGKATIISHSFSDPSKILPSNLPQLYISNTKLVYRLVSVRKLVAPYLQFTASYSLDPSTTGETILLIPATDF